MANGIFHFFFMLFKIDLKEREGGEREEGGRDIDVKGQHQSVASCTHSDWGSNLQPFGVGDDTPTN